MFPSPPQSSSSITPHHKTFTQLWGHQQAKFCPPSPITPGQLSTRPNLVRGCKLFSRQNMNYMNDKYNAWLVWLCCVQHICAGSQSQWYVWFDCSHYPSVVVLMYEDCDRQPRLWFSQRLFTEKCRRGEFLAPAAALMQSCVIVAVIVEQSSIQSTDKCQQKEKKDLIINKSCLPEATHVTPVAKNKDQMPLDSDSQVTASTALAILHANMCNFPSIYCQ